MSTKQEQQIAFTNALKAIDNIKEEDMGGFGIDYYYIIGVLLDMLKDNNTTVTMDYGRPYTIKVTDVIQQPLVKIGNKLLFKISKEQCTTTTE